MKNSKLWEYDKSLNTIVAFRVLKSIPTESTILALAFVFSVIYLFTSLEIVFNNISFKITIISWYALALKIVLPRIKHTAVINGFIIIPLIATLIIGFPTSFTNQVSHYFNAGIDPFYYKLNNLGVKIVFPFIFILAYIGRPIINKNAGLINFPIQIYQPGRFGKIFTFIFIAAMSIYIYSNLGPDLPAVSYFSRIFYYSFKWFFFWLGLWNLRLGKPIYYGGLLILIANAAIIFITGGRYSAAESILVFMLGLYLDRDKQTRKVYLRYFLLAIPIGILLLGAMGLIRNKIGRAEEFNDERSGAFISSLGLAVGEIITDSEFRSQAFEELLWRTKGGGALSRVIMLSPSWFPYRGMDNVEKEIESIFQIAALSGGFDRESLLDQRKSSVDNNLGTAAANIYGFNVTTTNSVEWSVTADAYSRGGYFVVCLYFLIALFWFTIISKSIRLITKNPFIIALMFTVMVRIMYSDFISDPLYLVLRNSILYLTFSYAILHGTYLLTKYTRKS